MLLLVQVIVVAFVVWLALYLVGLIPVPNPPGPIPIVKIFLQAVIVLVAIVVLLELVGLFRGPFVLR